MGAILAIAAGAVLLAAVLGHLAVGSDLLAPSVGPATALRAGEATAMGVGALGVSTALRALSSRRTAFAVLEVGLVALAFAELVVAHRNGAINRPFDIADPIIAQGGDPTWAMIAIGSAAALVIVLLLLSERSLLRSVLHLSLVVAVLLGVVGTTAMIGMPSPPMTGAGLGLRSDEEREGDREEEGEGGEGGGRRNNEELEFRDNYDNAANRVPLGVVLFHDDYSSPTGVYYFRQGAFSQYNGRRLVVSSRADVDRDIAQSFPTAPMEIDDPPEPGADRATLDTTVALLADHNRPFALESPLSMRPQTNPDARRFKRVYRATSAALTADYASLLGRSAGDAGWPREVWEHYTAAPDDPRYRELALRIVHERLPEDIRDDPMAKALAITDYLGEQGVYSLRSRHSDAEDPTASFLFGDKTGYCVHFAHAAVYMMRTLGLPARVATGYAVDEATRQGGSAVLVSGASSHAWPETYVDGTGWVTVDVAPQTVLTPPPPPPDPDLQRLLAELVRGEDLLPIDGREPPAIASMAGQALLSAGEVVLGLVLVTLFFLVAVKLWRRGWPLAAPAASLPRVVYRAELDRLAELALRRRFGESREAFAARVAEVAPSFRGLTLAHVGAAFGSRRAAADLRPLASEVRREVRRAYPWWRRTLGALIPWSWLLAR
jgi:transglutaminase-like putative cysteine protease